MPLRDDLLNPIPGDKPAGIELRYDPIYDKIKEARREDDEVPQGEWTEKRKLADYPAVIKMAGEALATKSKDLQVAAWLTEAMLRREGFGGLAGGLTLLRELTGKFWDGLYPEIEDGDMEMRAAPLEWVGTRFDRAIKSAPLNKAGHDYFKYKESRTIPTEKDVEADDTKAPARQEALADGKLAPEEFDKSFDGTPKTWYRQLSGDLDASIAAVDALDGVTKERFGDASPNFVPIKDSLAEVQRAVQQLLAKKLEKDPDPVAAGAPGEPAFGGAATAATVASAGGGAGGLAAEPVSTEDATARVVGAARYLRQHEPSSPVSYLLLRALRWGELRASGSNPDPRLLDAPAGASRTQLKTLLLDQDWNALLEAAETVMGTPAGRGWLDLQRYVLNALHGLGQDYEAVTRSIQREIRGLLAEIPGLPDMALMDDLPTAGPATITWLKTDGLMGDASAASDDGAPAPVAATPAPAAARDRLLDRAMTEVRAGRTQKGIELLKRELDRETSARGRFIRQTQLATVMVAAGLEPVARPILEELLRIIEGHKLEEWEAAPLVAEPLALLYRCLEKMDGDPELRQTLYLRICRLDPMQAIGFQTAAGRTTTSDGESGA